MLYHKRCEFESHSTLCVLDTTLCDKVSVTCDGYLVLLDYSGFFHLYNWLPPYNWDIVEIGAKHHKPNPKPYAITFLYVIICTIPSLLPFVVKFI
jgi:hypothetical protein